MSAVNHYRAKVASLSRSRSSSDTELIENKRQLAAAKLEAYISRVIAEAPPLTPGQLDRIAVLLRPAVGGAK